MKKISYKHYVCLSLLTVFSSPSFALDHDFGPVDMGSFYSSIPASQPNAKLGALLKVEKISTSMPGVNAWRIAYVSSDVEGRKTISTGIIAAPVSKAPSSGRPIVAWAHGTTGTAQTCGPSQVLNPAQPLNQYFSPTGNSWTDFGLPGMEALIKAGYVIVATDYQGLGGGGKHQYTVAATQARDVINSIRAASIFTEAHAGSKAIVYGWSQGGGATLAAAGLTDYLNAKDSVNDGIQLVGFVAMAPFDVAVTIPSEKLDAKSANKYLQALGDSFSGNIFNFTHYAQNIWGMTAAFPALKLTDIFTEEGAKAVNGIFVRKCMHVASDSFNYTYHNEYKKLLRSDIQNPVLWIEANKKGSVLPVKPMAPVIIYFGNHDTTVPPIMGELYYKQMCKLGGNITRIQLPGDQTHFSTPPVAEPLYVKWIADRFADKPVEHSCA
ncbi:MAG: alpha/beta fold hydrolase [Gammaproteobacteria bacterium]|nr:alpha/beta fold hydrolase [Gammaproteobacteria bacterium]